MAYTVAIQFYPKQTSFLLVTRSKYWICIAPRDELSLDLILAHPFHSRKSHRMPCVKRDTKQNPVSERRKFGCNGIVPLLEMGHKFKTPPTAAQQGTCDYKTVTRWQRQ